MDIKIALAGNPNSGKTTLFNGLTGANQYVGNWPGVTVEKKEGKLKKQNDVVITDLPGIYSLSPYTLEEVVARNYLITEKPNAILNIVDGTNLERNLYLTTQLIELGIPVVVAINMMDVVNKNGDKIDTKALAEKLGCKVVEISALKGTGIKEAADEAIKLAKADAYSEPKCEFADNIETAVAKVKEIAGEKISGHQERFFAVKLLERDSKAFEQLDIQDSMKNSLEEVTKSVEDEMDDDIESIITNERYTYITSSLKSCYNKKSAGKETVSDKIDKIVTNRFLAIPIFAVVMFLVYAIAMGPWAISIGTAGTDWANDCLFGDGYHLFGIGSGAYGEAAAPFEDANGLIGVYEMEAENAGVDLSADKTFVVPASEDADEITFAAYEEAQAFLENNEEPDPAEFGVWVPGIPALFDMMLLDKDGNPRVADWLYGLIMDGIVGGVGAVLGFVPQMLVLFLFLAMLEDCGYMARIAFVMDRLFRRFGLSGKSFIPMLVSTGCGVPGIMASRTIEQDRDRKLTIITTGFIPCGAKMPIIGLFAGAIFGNNPLVAVSAFFIGIASVVVSGIMLKKTKAFAGDPAPFVMELPAYHVPTVGNVLRATWERGWSFIKRAGTVILLSAIILWFLMSYGFVDGAFGAVEDINQSILASIGQGIAWLFYPLGWMGDMAWRAAVATVTGLIAKEEVVLTIASLYGKEAIDDVGTNIWMAVGQDFTAITTYSFMIFQLLCAPCFAAMGAIKREMNNWKWTTFAITYMCVFAYAISMIVYQIGGLFTGEAKFSVFTVIAIVLLGGILFQLFRPYKESTKLAMKEVASK